MTLNKYIQGDKMENKSIKFTPELRGLIEMCTVSLLLCPHLITQEGGNAVLSVDFMKLADFLVS